MIAKLSRNIGVASKRQRLPSTNEYFMENVVRAPMQVALCVIDLNPPTMNPLRHR